MSQINLLAVFDHLAAGNSMTVGELLMVKNAAAELIEAAEEAEDFAANEGVNCRRLTNAIDAVKPRP